MIITLISVIGIGFLLHFRTKGGKKEIEMQGKDIEDNRTVNIPSGKVVG